MIKFVLSTKSINTILYHHRMMSKDFSQFYENFCDLLKIVKSYQTKKA